MTIYHIFSLCGGLGLFLLGMKMMSEGLSLAAGDRMQAILEKLTSNRFIGVIVGAVITALIQSSSATTVMVVGFVNTGLMTLIQAVWVIMGANIGTTITGQMIALDIGQLAPIIAFVGVLILTFVKKKSITCWGQIIAGLGIVFIGMSMMSEAMMPLREEPVFIDMMTKFDNPIIGIAVGALFTALIQSSSASVGILQALAKTGLISIYSASFILFGQNIGTCITALLASIGTSRNAKRTTIIHLLFNLIGTAIFVVACMALPLAEFIESITPDNVSAQIANMHTFFNIATTLLLLPFGTYLAKLATVLLPVKEDEHKPVKMLTYINENSLGSTMLAFASVKNELSRMMTMTLDNMDLCFSVLHKKDDAVYSKIYDNEKYVDYLNIEISNFISQITAKSLSETDGYLSQSFFKITNDLERIADHAYNLGQHSIYFEEEKVKLKEFELEGFDSLQELINDSFKQLYLISTETFETIKETIYQNEDQVNHLVSEYRQAQIKRLSNKECNASTCVIFSDILTDIERIHDYVVNIMMEAGQVNFNFNQELY